jgi:hypothetical protein
MPQIENVTQITIGVSNGGCPNGVEHENKANGDGECGPLCQKATKKEKPIILNEFTRLTGCHRKPVEWLLSGKPVRETLVYADSGAVNRAANREVDRTYSDEVIDALRRI